MCELTGKLLTLGNGDSVRAYCNLNVNGRSVRLMLDDGSTVYERPYSDASSIDGRNATMVSFVSGPSAAAAAAAAAAADCAWD